MIFRLRFPSIYSTGSGVIEGLASVNGWLWSSIWSLLNVNSQNRIDDLPGITYHARSAFPLT